MHWVKLQWKMFGPFMKVFFIPLLKVDYVVITDLLDERVLVGGAFLCV
jgi:hypothetical protein